MSNTVINVRRMVAKGWGARLIEESFVSDQDLIWISIGEPDVIFSDVTHTKLDRYPTLKENFWDVTEPLTISETVYNPPTIDHAAKIVDFIIANPGKDIVVNCAAGKSRSGAICQFCEEHLGYTWPDYTKKNAKPNTTLYRLMVEHYYSTYAEYS